MYNPVQNGNFYRKYRGIEGPPVASAKSFIEVAICTSSNILVWFGRDASEKGVAGLTESLISSPLAIAKGLVKYERPNSRT